LAKKAGLEFIEFGTAEEFLALANNPDMWHPRRALPLLLKQGVLPALRPLYRLIEQNILPGKTIVAAGSLAFAALIAREKLRVPTAMIHLQPSLFRSVHEAPVYPAAPVPPWFPPSWKKIYFKLVDAVVDRMAAPELNAFRAELGLAPVRSLMGDWWHSPDLTLGLFPEWYAPPQMDWPTSVRLTGFPLYDGAGTETTSDGVDAFLEAGEPPLVFTAGSAMRLGQKFFRTSAEVCRRLGRRGLLLTRFPDQVPSPLPEGVRTFEYAPFSQVFHRAAVVVHHGGIGTTSQALRSGRPQLVVPFSHDQPDNAARVAKLGAGLSLPARQYRAVAVLSRIERLLSDRAIANRCREISRRFEGERSLERTCDEMEKLISF